MNTILQTCFFAISEYCQGEEAIGKNKNNSIQKNHTALKDEIVKKNFEAVDKTLENLFE